MPTKAANMRLEKIHDFLNRREATATTISNELKIPYVSVCRLLRILEDEGKIKAATYKHGDGGFMYTAVELDPMINVKSFGNTVPVVALFSEMAERAKTTDGRFTSDAVEDALHYLAKSISTLLFAAFQLSEDGETNEEAIKAARDTLLKCEKVFAEMAALCREILDERRFWLPNELLQLTKSKYWNSRIVVDGYRVFTERTTNERD